ncbi:MAG TPA: hypothetical protein PK624_09010 [Spirochaetota bacterium]|nr:hypothetical protein [Spirochaetota bacterium]HOR44921.1 hypothetical protein [Spirochaetota bacterium]HPK56476.1 hypothetical protein [Spirochaetota bacterium]
MDAKSVELMLEFLKLINDNLSNSSNYDLGLKVAFISVGSAVATSLIALITQLFVTNRIIRSEMYKVNHQIITQSNVSRLNKKKEKIVSLVSELLTLTDPEINPKIDKLKIITCVHKIQLMLDNFNKNESILNDQVNQLVLMVNGWINDQDSISLLSLMGKITDNVKQIYNDPIV